MNFVVSSTYSRNNKLQQISWVPKYQLINYPPYIKTGDSPHKTSQPLTWSIHFPVSWQPVIHSQFHKNTCPQFVKSESILHLYVLKAFTF
jgi:hypothetical protein